jgi:orotate phosphoribosyltransferase/predicted amidohydrolase
LRPGLPLGDLDERPGTIEGLIAEGYLARDGATLCPGLLLNLAQAADSSATAISHLLPEPDGTVLRDELLLSMRLREARTIPLLHSDQFSAHYFECDTLLVERMTGRRLLAQTLRELISCLEIDTLACPIIPQGLFGVYPLCFHAALEKAMTVAALFPQSRNESSFVGSPDLAGRPTLIVTDALSTGRSVIEVQEALLRANASPVGVFAIYDREEGAPQLLQDQGLSTVSLISRSAMRAHAASIIRERAAEDATLQRQASGYLAATARLRVAELDLHLTHKELATPVQIAVAPHLAPRTADFDKRMHIIPDAASTASQRLTQAIQVAAEAGCHLLILPELSLPLDCSDQLAEASSTLGMILIAGAEYDESGANVALIAIAGQVYRQAKLVRSPYDADFMCTGDLLQIFKNTAIGNFAVLVCADQMDFRLLEELVGRVDFVVVAARNRSVTTSAGIATGDAYRLYCYILYVNDHEYGKSYLASPSRGKDKLAWLTPGSNGLAFCRLDVDGLRKTTDVFHKRIALGPRRRKEE